MIILLLLGKDLLRYVSRIGIDHVGCVPIEVKHLRNLWQLVPIGINRLKILSEDGFLLLREPCGLVAVILNNIRCHGYYDYQTYDYGSWYDTGPSAFKPGLRVLITLDQGHADAGPLPKKHAIDLGVMIVVSEVVEEAINCFYLAIHEPVIVMLLAALGEAEAHASHTN